VIRGAADALAADRSARTAAQGEFERPLVVEAGAGTGKTATLVARILAWCLGVGWDRAAVEEAQTLARQGKPGPPDAERIAATVLDGVVAITFTEAAAAEMAARVAEALALTLDGGCPQGFDASAVQADPGEHQARARALLVALDHLTVCTIHAFCRRILASFPLEAGLEAFAYVKETPCLKVLLATAARGT
jgi:ATP-dependent exoDNAse (exonuclease V) beta subunit